MGQGAGAVRAGENNSGEAGQDVSAEGCEMDRETAKIGLCTQRRSESYEGG
jgi:hypothetical protein